jgi:hypothetical protein
MAASGWEGEWLLSQSRDMKVRRIALSIWKLETGGEAAINAV